MRLISRQIDIITEIKEEIKASKLLTEKFLLEGSKLEPAYNFLGRLIYEEKASNTKAETKEKIRQYFKTFTAYECHITPFRAETQYYRPEVDESEELDLNIREIDTRFSLLRACLKAKFVSEIELIEDLFNISYYKLIKDTLVFLDNVDEDEIKEILDYVTELYDFIKKVKNGK